MVSAVTVVCVLNCCFIIIAALLQQKGIGRHGACILIF